MIVNDELVLVLVLNMEARDVEVLPELAKGVVGDVDKEPMLVLVMLKDDEHIDEEEVVDEPLTLPLVMLGEDVDVDDVGVRCV